MGKAQIYLSRGGPAYGEEALVVQGSELEETTERRSGSEIVIRRR